MPPTPLVLGSPEPSFALCCSRPSTWPPWAFANIKHPGAAFDGASSLNGRVDPGRTPPCLSRSGRARFDQTRRSGGAGAPNWAESAWASFKAALPGGEDWDVWIDWYEDRLRGGSRGEAHELVFANVPPEVWDEGPAAANAWIEEHLPKGAGGPFTRPASGSPGA